MLTTVPGTFKDGAVHLLEQPQDITEARVLVTFLPSESGGHALHRPAVRRSEKTGLPVIDLGPNAPAKTSEMVREALADFP